MIARRGTRQPYCHACVAVFSPFRKGKCCPFFVFCFSVAGSASFAVFFCSSSLLRVAVGNKFSGANFYFVCRGWGVEVGLVFFDVFCLGFVSGFGTSLPTLFGKILLMSGLPFLGSFSRRFRQPYCHTCVAVFPLFEGGNAVRFSFLCFSVAGSASFAFFFAVLLFLGSLLGINFRERTFVFGRRGWSCVFRWCFA